jgi:hypothetical protein
MHQVNSTPVPLHHGRFHDRLCLDVNSRWGCRAHQQAVNPRSLSDSGNHLT